MSFKGSVHRIFANPKYAFKRCLILTKKIQAQIERINSFLIPEDIPDKILKGKISLLSSLLDVRRKLRVELKELSQDTGKGEDSLGEILSTYTPFKE